MDKLPYQFDDEQRIIRFNRFDLPAPWINYLSNGRMHAFVSQAVAVAHDVPPDPVSVLQYAH